VSKQSDRLLTGMFLELVLLPWRGADLGVIVWVEGVVDVFLSTVSSGSHGETDNGD
jgi:hypothetical protein